MQPADEMLQLHSAQNGNVFFFFSFVFFRYGMMSFLLEHQGLALCVELFLYGSAYRPSFGRCCSL